MIPTPRIVRIRDLPNGAFFRTPCGCIRRKVGDTDGEGFVNCVKKGKTPDDDIHEWHWPDNMVVQIDDPRVT